MQAGQGPGAVPVAELLMLGEQEILQQPLQVKVTQVDRRSHCRRRIRRAAVEAQVQLEQMHQIPTVVQAVQENIPQ